MGSIYSKAAKTLIFLGLESKGTDCLMQSLDGIGQRAVEYGAFDSLAWETDFLANSILEYVPGRRGRKLMLRQTKSWNRTLENIISPTSTSLFGPTVSPTAIKTMMSLPWWSRVWVVQELLLSRSPWFIYGARMVQAEHIVASMKLLSLVLIYVDQIAGYDLIQPKLNVLDQFPEQWSNVELASPAISLHHFQRLLPEDDDVWSLGFVLSTMRNKSGVLLAASNPADHVYGFLGLVSDWPTNSQLIPDYSLDHVEVFARAMAACYHCKPLQVTLTKALLPKRMNGLPSWVPDWSARWNEPSSSFSGNNKLTPTYQKSQSGRHVLKIHGISYGTIQKVQVPNDKLVDVSELDSMDYDPLFDLFTSLLPPTALFSDQEAFHIFLLDFIAARILSADDITPVQMAKAQDFFALALDTDVSWRSRTKEEGPTGLDAIYAYDLDLIKEIYDAAILPRNDRSEESLRVLRWILHVLITRPQFYSVIQSLNPDGNETTSNEATFVGTAGPKVCSGDIVVEFDVEPQTLYVVRPVDVDGRRMFELVDQAWIPRLIRERELSSSSLPPLGGTVVDFELC